MKTKEKIIILNLTKDDRKLLKSIDNSLKAIQKGEVQELIIENLKKRKIV